MNLIEYKKTVRQMAESGDLALPDNVPLEAFRNAAIVAYTDNPQIARCKPESVFRALRKCAASGLVPDGHEAALVPYKDECQFIPMVAGLRKVARNSGEVAGLWDDVVYDGETIEIWIEDGKRRWNHLNEDGTRINPMKRGGDIIGAYAVAELKDGSVDFEPMSKEAIEKVRNVSRAKNGPAWTNWYDQMARKTAVRRLAKRLPMASDDRRRIIESDSDTIGDLKDVTPRRESLEDRLARETAPEGEPVAGEILPPEDAPEAPDEQEGEKA